MTAHAAAFGWAISTVSHVAVASWLLTQGDTGHQVASLAGGKVSHSVEIVVTLPPAPQPMPVIEAIREEAPPLRESSSRHPTPDRSMPLLDTLALARTGEASRMAPRRNVQLAPRERFAHAPQLSRQTDRSAVVPPTQSTQQQPARQHLPRSELTPRPPAPLSAVSVPSVLGTEVDELAKPIYNPPPVYPAAAVASKIEGRVMLRLTITATGDVSRVTVAESSGAPLLDRAALDAVRQWRFRPALRGGMAVEWSCQLPVRFRLDT
jgi:protein TonB